MRSTIEQVLIENYGLGKNGGTLLNKINSIAESNPIYADAIERGSDFLAWARYDGFSQGNPSILTAILMLMSQNIYFNSTANPCPR